MEFITFIQREVEKYLSNTPINNNFKLLGQSNFGDYCYELENYYLWIGNNDNDLINKVTASLVSIDDFNNNAELKSSRALSLLPEHIYDSAYSLISDIDRIINKK